jgi:PLP dependent protein
MANSVADNYLKVSDQIAQTARKAGRSAEDVKLVVVTKGQSVQKIAEVIQAGATDLGENYPEETTQKISEMGQLASAVSWHMIGHLQSRKIKFVVDHFSMMHSIDRPSIAVELNAKLDCSLDVLLEVNLSGEESKGGFQVSNPQNWAMFCETVLDLQKLERLRIVGLMTMPPYTEDPEASRIVFRLCRELRDFVQKETRLMSIAQLSMGTSLDYNVAVEEGATYVRVGEAIMGARDYSKKV